MAEEEGMPQQLTEEDLKRMSPEQIRELQKKSCIFCQIISGKIPSKKVYDDDKTFAILDINPANPGHILLMPKEHYMILPQMPPDIISHLFIVAKHLSMACIKALKVQGTNIFAANGAAAGQKAQHFMAHVIPRKANDGLTCFTLPRRQIPDEQLQKLNQILKARIAATMQKDGTPGKEGQDPGQKSPVPMATTKFPQAQSVPPVVQPLPKISVQPRTPQTPGSLDLDSLTDALTGQPSAVHAEQQSMPEHLEPPEHHGDGEHSGVQQAIAVFASKQGKKFHLQNCPFLQRAAQKDKKNVSRITQTDIKQRELKPCTCVTSITRIAR